MPTGVYLHKREEPEIRFLRQLRYQDIIFFVEPCWVWTGKLQKEGYSKFNANDKLHWTHRWAYEYFVGPIPEGLDLDHLCRNRACCNPTHLEPVTRKMNLYRGIGNTTRKTHCLNGHEYTIQNTGYNGVYRFCRTCKNDRRRKVY